MFTEQEIKFFEGEYRFLSNFSIYPTFYEGLLYPTSEHAYQAAKSLDLEERKQFLLPQNKSPSISKVLGRKVKLRDNWNDIKADIMLEIVRDKFNRNLDAKSKLLDTKDAYLEEGNTWHDTFFGKCYCNKCNGKGLNWLGKILMKIRNELRKD